MSKQKKLSTLVNFNRTMTAPKKDKMLFTNEERKRLLDSSSDAEIRKRNSLIVRRKIKNWLNQSEDVLFALDFLSEKQLERTVDDIEIFMLLKTIELFLYKLNFVPVKGPIDNPYVTWCLDSDNGKLIANMSRRAKESDFERNWQLQKHIEALQELISMHLEEEPAYKKYREDRECQGSIDIRKKRNMVVDGKEDIFQQI